MIRRWLLTHGMNLSAYLGYPIAQAIQFLRRTERWTPEAMKAHQGRSLQSLITHCYEHVPYYRDLMQQRRLTPDDFKSPHDLNKLPYLTRDILRTEGTRLRADNYPDSICQVRRSGGTTGEPIAVAIDVRGRAYEVAAYLRGFTWMGYGMGAPMVRLFGGSLGMNQTKNLRTSMREWLFNSRFIPAFELTPDNVEEYMDVIHNAKNGSLVGYTSAIYNLAEYMQRKGLHGSPLSSVICTAEVLPIEWRHCIQEVLNAPVYSYYGCGEVNSLAYEHTEEPGYIVTQEHVILEVANMNPEQFCEEGQGQACITTLFNYAMPLIRYLNGDILKLQYPASGLPHSRIIDIEGRIVDQLLRTDGHKLSGAFIPHLVFKSGFPAWKYQVVQSTVDHIDFHYLLQADKQFSEKMTQDLRKVFQHHLGQDVQVNFVEGNFETTRSGKHRFVINKIAQG